MPRATLLDRYDALVAQGAFARDGGQVAALEQLEQLAAALAREPGAGGILRQALAALGRRRGPKTPRGLYLWGAVGRGKTTLMDLFFERLDVKRKRRAHFHAFMAEVHERLHHARAADAPGDPVARVATELAAETRMLCFDEFAVDDIADATILARLFSALFSAGVVVVATSNVEPARLYENGRNRDLFLPFIGLIGERMRVLRLDSPTDYRLMGEKSGDTFFAPADAAARAALDALFLRLAGDVVGTPTQIEVKRRRIDVPHAAVGVARFSFSEICGRPLGAADYLALAQTYCAIIVENVPVFDADRRNEARRFITLVDVLYEQKTLLALSAEASIESLCGLETCAEARDFPRAVSRLTEMRQRQWIASASARAASGETA